MDIMNLAHRLGLTNEEKIDRTQEFRKTRYINVSDAEKYICQGNLEGIPDGGDHAALIERRSYFSRIGIF